MAFQYNIFLIDPFFLTGCAAYNMKHFFTFCLTLQGLSSSRTFSGQGDLQDLGGMVRSVSDGLSLNDLFHNPGRNDYARLEHIGLDNVRN